MTDPELSLFGIPVVSDPYLTPCSKCGGEIVRMQGVNNTVVGCLGCGRVISIPHPERRFYRKEEKP